MKGKNIYKPIPEYKFKRLSFTKPEDGKQTFWDRYNSEPDTSIVYSMITTMVMQRFKMHEIAIVMRGWSKKHNYNLQPNVIQAIVWKVRDYTLEDRRQKKREEMRRYRAKKKAQREELLKVVGASVCK